MDARLHSYITRKYLPVDVSEFLRKGPSKNLCLFCGNPHDNVQFDIISGERSHNVADTGQMAHLCLSCSNILQNVKNKSYNGDINLADVLIDTYIKNRSLPKDVLEHQHGQSKESQCVFCKAKIFGHPMMVMDKNHTVISIPIAGKANCYPSNVMVCKTCILRYPKILNVNDTYKHDVCTLCGVAYPITNDEIHLRAVFDSQGQHVCGTCWVDKLHHLYNDNRFRHPKCVVCEEDYEVDLTCTMKREISYVGHNKWFCDKHIGLSVNPEREYVWSTIFKNKYIRVTKNMLGARYEIIHYNPEALNKPHVRFMSPHMPGKLDSAIVAAHEKLSEIMEYEDLNKLFN